MEILLGFMSSLARYLAFNTFFFLVGWLALKLVTLGRYPRTLNPREPEAPDVQILAVFGMFVFVGAAIFLAWLFR